MTNNVPIEIVERIKKLLELTTSPNEAEASQAMSFAQKLMLKYSVSYEALNSEEFKEAIATEIYDNEMIGKPGISEHIPTILSIIPPLFGVHCTITRKPRTYKMIGFPTNITIAKFACDSIIAQGLIDARISYKLHRTVSHGVSFWQGFVLGLSKKFKAPDSKETAIAVYDKVKQYVNSIAKGTFSVAYTDGVALNAGIESGLNAEIRRGLNTSNTGKLLR